MTSYCHCKICERSPMKVNGNENGQAETASPERYRLPDGYQLVHFSKQSWPSLRSRELVEFDVSVVQRAASAAPSMGGQGSVSAACSSVLGVSASAPPIGSHADAASGFASKSDGAPAEPAPQPAFAGPRYRVGLFCFAFPIDHDFKGKVPKELSLMLGINPYSYIYLISPQVLAGARDVTMHVCRTSHVGNDGLHPQIALAIGCGGRVLVASSASRISINGARVPKTVLSTPGRHPGPVIVRLPGWLPWAVLSSAPKPDAPPTLPSALHPFPISGATSSSSAASPGLYVPSLLNAAQPAARANPIGAKPGVEAVDIVAGQFGTEVLAHFATGNGPPINPPPFRPG